MSTETPTTLPKQSQARKDIPLNAGLFEYFPAALMSVAKLSKQGNDKHNPDEPLHHARGKSRDHRDCILRHLMDLNDYLSAGNDVDILVEATCLAWRALALCQELHEDYLDIPLAPGARQ